jgi:hypothetical protein
MIVIQNVTCTAVVESRVVLGFLFSDGGISSAEARAALNFEELLRHIFPPPSFLRNNIFFVVSENKIRFSVFL